MVKMANCLLYSFSGIDPVTLTRLFNSFCLSLHGAAIWNLSNPSLRSLEVAFNNILRKIWRLPLNCHTRILHLTAKLISPFNLIYRRSQSLFTSATTKSPSSVVRYVFSSSVNLCYNATGYNSLFGDSHVKHYSSEDAYCASVIRDLCLFGSASWSNELTIRTLSTVWLFCLFFSRLYFYLSLHLCWYVAYIIIIIITLYISWPCTEQR